MGVLCISTFHICPCVYISTVECPVVFTLSIFLNFFCYLYSRFHVHMYTCITVYMLYMSFDECLNVFVDTLLSILLLHICFCCRISIVFISAFICCLLYNPVSHLSLCSSLISRVPVSIFLV